MEEELEKKRETDNNRNNDSEDLGSITSPPEEVRDYGTLDLSSTPTTCFIATGGIPDSENNSGIIKIVGKSITKKISQFKLHQDLNSLEIVYCGIVLTWIGFGTVFEFDNGYERITSPYLSSGTVR
jgi:hypothetical protein